MLIKHKAFLLLTIGAHYVVFASFVLTVLFSFILFNWYVATTIDALVFRVIFSSSECPLTTLENYFRDKCGIMKSKGFLKDWIIFPKRTFKYVLNKLK